MTRKELELKVELLEQKIKTLELELELHKHKSEKEYVSYWPTIHPYPVWIDDSRRKNDWDYGQPYCETVSAGTPVYDLDNFITY